MLIAFSSISGVVYGVNFGNQEIPFNNLTSQLGICLGVCRR